MENAVKYLIRIASLPVVLAEGQRQDQHPVQRLEGYPDTFYVRTLPELPPTRPPLKSDVETDVCVVGGGLAGITTALGLAERGKKVVVLEQQRVGWGASGVNGGFVLAGFALEGPELVEEVQVGEETAVKMYRMSLDAQNLLRKRIDEYKIDCQKQEVGSITLSMFGSREDEWRKEIAEFNKTFGTKMELWSRDKVKQFYSSDMFYHAVYDPSAFMVQPLALTLGLARAAEQCCLFSYSYDPRSPDVPRRGARIYEHSKATELKAEGAKQTPGRQGRRWKVTTEGGAAVVAADVVLAGSGHLAAGLHGAVGRAVVPCLSYIMVTEPLGPRLAAAIRAPHGAFDDRFALNYFRPLPDGRLLWGGFFQTYPISERRLERVMMKDLLRVFPQLEGVKADSVWGGSLAYGRDMMPMVGQADDQPGLWYSTGFGGHGLVPTTVAGELLASAIATGGQDDRYRLFQRAFPLKYAFWPFGTIGAQLFYWQLQLQDSFALWRQRRGW